MLLRRNLGFWGQISYIFVWKKGQIKLLFCLGVGGFFLCFCMQEKGIFGSMIITTCVLFSKRSIFYYCCCFLQVEVMLVCMCVCIRTCCCEWFNHQSQSQSQPPPPVVVVTQFWHREAWCIRSIHQTDFGVNGDVAVNLYCIQLLSWRPRQKPARAYTARLQLWALLQQQLSIGNL